MNREREKTKSGRSRNRKNGGEILPVEAREGYHEEGWQLVGQRERHQQFVQVICLSDYHSANSHTPDIGATRPGSVSGLPLRRPTGRRGTPPGRGIGKT